MSADDLRDHLTLALAPGLGPKLTAALLAHFGSPQAVLAAGPAELRRVPLVGDKLANSFHGAFRAADVDAELKLLGRHGVRAVPLGHPDYPPRLTTVSDPPPLVYLKGEPAAADANAVAIVGSRACTEYGKRTAARIAAGLARAGWTVVSGLARGVDGAAHRAALDAGGRTVAVLAGGLSRIYPPEHAELADAVARQGYLLTETTMAMSPQPGMFPARNRLVSALSRGVVVVEANVKSGALITVSHAAEQGRETFAVPGPADAPTSAGCHDLIRKGARLVRDADDILEDLLGISPPDPPAAKGEKPSLPFPNAPPVELDADQRKVWDALASPRLGDELSRAVGLTVAELARVLMGLELKRLVRRLPGNRYERR